MSEPSARSESPNDEETEENIEQTNDNGDQPPPRKRQRVRLSCLECRRRKLSCDRELPCSRCMQSGTPERCEYETRPGLAPPNKLGLSQSALTGYDNRLGSLPAISEVPFGIRKDGGSREQDRIRRLELEVQQLKNLLGRQVSLDGSTVNDHSPLSLQKPTPPQVEPDHKLPHFIQYQDVSGDKDELRFFRGKEFKTRFFGPHSAVLAFSELTGLTPFMKETAEEWLRPLHIHTKDKDRCKDKAEREKKFLEPNLELEALLPSKEETDALINIYLDQFEQVNRIIHIPSFRRYYEKFWDPTEIRAAACTALVLAMIAISSCLDEHLTPRFEKMISSSHKCALKWIRACEEWLQQQSQKHRRLIHYQIACLLYLSKRVNTMKKKRFWTGAGVLTQDAISVGLHREPSHMLDKISPFNQEMRRRIWATIQNFDLQASFDHGLPSILGNLHYDVNPPRNIDDEEFDEDSTTLPPSKAPDQYTFASYQHLNRQSLPLRLELSKVLTGPPEDIDYDQVIKYTNEINQEIDSLPSWDVSEESQAGVLKKPLLAYTLLHIQLRQYIIPLHQPYLRLRKANSKYQYSEIVYYNAARDMVLLHDRLVQQGIRTLNFLREDNLTLAINLCHVTMLQPRGSTNMIMINSQHTRELLEKCLKMKEDRILRCGNNEPWGYSIMCAAVGLLEAHLGTKTPEAAKIAAAERFVNLHYKLLAGQDPPPSSQQFLEQAQAHAQSSAQAHTQPLPASAQAPIPGPGQTASIPGSIPATPIPPPPHTMFQPQPPPEPFIRSKSVTPFPIPSASQGSTGGPGIVEVPGTPWWMPNTDGISGVQAPSLNSDLNFEMLGVNLNELWGVDQWDFDPSS